MDMHAQTDSKTPIIEFKPSPRYEELRRQAEVLFRLALAREQELYECLDEMQDLKQFVQKTRAQR